MSAPVQTRSGLFGMLLLSTGAAFAFLLAEWLFVSRLGFSLRQGEVSRTLVSLAGAAVCAGAGGAIAAALLGRWCDRMATAVAAPIAALLFLDIYFALGSTPVLKLLSAGGLGGLVYLVLVSVLPRAPAWLHRAASWWNVAAVLAALALAITALHAVDATGTWLAAGAALVAVVLLVVRRAGYLASAAVVAAAAMLAIRVPVWQPVNNYAAGKPSVLLVTIDTLRADRVGSYGYARARTPVFDGLAAAGYRFSQTVTANAFTGPSHASILTGQYPENHGVLVNHQRLSPTVPTLADILREEGYVTGAFTSGYITEDSACGLPSHFQSWDDDIRAFRWLPTQARKMGVMELQARLVRAAGWYRGDFGQSYRMGADTADIAIAWLGANGKHPFFVWTHFYDPHIPYRPPREYRTAPDAGVSGQWYDLNSVQRSEIVNSPERVAAMHALYDAEVAYADAQLGRVVSAAQAAAPDGKLLIVVTSDHGESMGEHHLYWERDLYDPTLLVPLVIVPPKGTGLAGGVIDAQVRSIDLAPTILDILGIKAAAGFDGSSLTGLMDGSRRDGTGAAFSGLYPDTGEFARNYHSVRTDGWKLIQDTAGWVDGGRIYRPADRFELYHLASDAAELVDLAGREPEQRASLEALLATLNRTAQKPELDLSPEERERLRSLGYIH